MTQPLYGKRVLVTRMASQAEALCRLLGDAGARVVVIPVMELRALLDQGARDALRVQVQKGDFDDLVFTSANAVQLLLMGQPVPQGSVRAFAIGPGTAATLEKAGWKVESLPDAYIAESLAELIGASGVEGRRFLLPRARGAREVLPKALREAGAAVCEIELYEMAPALSSADRLREELRSGALDIITFTSGSAVRSFAALAPDAGGPLGCLIACIGPVTAAEVFKVGMVPDVVAADHSMGGLVEALAAAVASLPENGAQP